MAFLSEARAFYRKLPKGLIVIFLFVILAGVLFGPVSMVLSIAQAVDYVRAFPVLHPDITKFLAVYLSPLLVITGFVGLFLIFLWATLNPHPSNGVDPHYSSSSLDVLSSTSTAFPPITSEEVSDDEIVPTLLERLPGEQWQLLLDLHLGEKVFPLGEPGLEDLERNRLAQRLRQVAGDTYLFRLHPANAERVHAFYTAKTITPTPTLPKTPNVSADAVAALQVAYHQCKDALWFVLDHLSSRLFGLAPSSFPELRGRRVLIANLLQPVVGEYRKRLKEFAAIQSVEGECAADQFQGFKLSLVEVLEIYVSTGYYLLATIPELVAEASLPEERQRYARWMVNNRDSTKALRLLVARHEFRDMKTDVFAAMERLGRSIGIEIAGVEFVNGEGGTALFRALHTGPLDLVVVGNAPIESLAYRKEAADDWNEVEIESRGPEIIAMPTFSLKENELVTIKATSKHALFAFDIRGVALLGSSPS